MADVSTTRCPKCHTLFRVTATQLKKAKGKVRCGHCQHVFAASAHIISPPATAPVIQNEKPVSPITPKPAVNPKPITPSNTDYIELGHPIKTEPVKPARTPTPPFTDSIIGESPHYNKLDNLGSIAIPGDIIGMESVNLHKDDIKPVAPPAPTKPPTRQYEDKEHRENPPTIDDIDTISKIYEAATDAITELPQDELLHEPEEIILSGAATQNDFADFDINDLPTAPAEEPSTQIIKSKKSKSAKQTIDLDFVDHPAFEIDEDTDVKPKKGKPAVHEPVMPFSLRSSMSELEIEERAWWVRPLQISAVLLLIVGLLFQVLMFRNVQLVKRFPSTTKPMTWFCNHFPCSYTGGRDVSKIQLLNRDVRSHPTAKNALLITISFANQATFDQPYPKIQLSLSNLSGEFVAYREFTPQEYLDKLYNQFIVMESGTPVHVTLAVIDPGDDAMNFEFSFR